MPRGLRLCRDGCGTTFTDKRHDADVCGADSCKKKRQRQGRSPSPRAEARGATAIDAWCEDQLGPGVCHLVLDGCNLYCRLQEALGRQPRATELAGAIWALADEIPGRPVGSFVDGARGGKQAYAQIYSGILPETARILRRSGFPLGFFFTGVKGKPKGSGVVQAGTDLACGAAVICSLLEGARTRLFSADRDFLEAVAGFRRAARAGRRTPVKWDIASALPPACRPQ